MKVTDLYNKITAFEENLSPIQREKTNCKKGCSQCCMVNLSVFQVEADNIRSWFQNLSPERKEAIKNAWKKESLPSACSFLKDDACTIYEARPLICRSQGLAFKFQETGTSYIDICPLNDELLATITEKEILNLDLLNLILSQMENLNSLGTQRPRVKLSDLLRELENL